jgi:hypothetical protein
MPDALRGPMPHYPLAIPLMFQSFFMGGFECSTHRLLSGKRLDVTAATCHDKFAAAGYQRLQQQGIYTVREGICWHLIEWTAFCFQLCHFFRP